MTDCVFCKIIAGDLPCHKLHEDDQVIAIMDAGQVNPGHALVLSKEHAADMMALDEDTAAQAFRIANRLAKAQAKQFDAEGVTILQANREVGFQTVFHFHLHVVPRYANDGMALTWPAKMPPPDELAAHAETLRAGLRNSA